MRISNSSDFAKEIVAFQPVNPQGFFATTVFRSSIHFLNHIYTLWNATTASLQTVANLTYNIDFQSIPAFMPGNSLGLEFAIANGNNVTSSLILCLLSNYWSDAADSPLVIATTQSLLRHIEEASRQEGVGERFQYINYAAKSQDPIASYGAASQARLRAVGRKYDPDGVFQKQVPGGFKLFPG